MSDSAGGVGSTSALQEFDSELQHQVADAVQGLSARSEQAFARAAQQLETIRSTATHLVDNLAEEAEKAIGLIQQAEDMLRQRFSALQESEQQHSGEVADTLAQTTDGLGQIDSGIQSIEAGGHALESGAHAQLQQFTSDVQHALQELQNAIQASQEQIDSFGRALDQLGSETQRHGEETAHALENLANHLSQLVEEAKNVLGQAASNASQQLEHEISTTMHELGSIGGQALDAIKALMGNADDTGSSITDEIHDVMEVIQKVLDLIDRIRPVLELAEQLS